MSTKDIYSYILTQEEINEIISIYLTNKSRGINQYTIDDYYMSYRDIANLYGVSKSTIENIIDKYNNI